MSSPYEERPQPSFHQPEYTTSNGSIGRERAVSAASSSLPNYNIHNDGRKSFEEDRTMVGESERSDNGLNEMENVPRQRQRATSRLTIPAEYGAWRSSEEYAVTVQYA